jgi:hypothetical protein
MNATFFFEVQCRCCIYATCLCILKPLLDPLCSSFGDMSWHVSNRLSYRAYQVFFQCAWVFDAAWTSACRDIGVFENGVTQHLMFNHQFSNVEYGTISLLKKSSRRWWFVPAIMWQDSKSHVPYNIGPCRDSPATRTSNRPAGRAHLRRLRPPSASCYGVMTSSADGNRKVKVSVCGDSRLWKRRAQFQPPAQPRLAVRVLLTEWNGVT